MALDIPDTSVCLNCRYLLRGLDIPVCPECGRQFDPEVPATYTDQNHRGILYRWSHPPRNWLRYMLIFWAVTSLMLASDPGSSFYDFSESLGGRRFFWFLPTTIWLMPLAIGAICLAIGLQHLASWTFARRLHKKGAPQFNSQLMKWWWAPLCVGLVLSTLLYSWPIWIRFQFCRSSLESMAKNQLAIGKGVVGDQSCGGYQFDAVLIYPLQENDVAFLTVSKEIGAGFIYSPDPDLDRDFAHRLGKHWFYTTNWGNWPW
ncbi:MAG: hypothetical protein R3E58_20735 [Phycisphaerae bacterium]|nr:hypothetical protein [Phycisphaerales bacterium]